MFSDRLIKLRENLGLSQLEVSKRLGIARTTYSGYETGAREPNLETLEKMAGLFDVSLDYLITGSEKDLTEEQEELLWKFIKLNDNDQQMIIDFMERLKKSSN